MNSTTHRPKVSIIIRTFNEEKHLPVLLDALKDQDFQDFETIVVDSGSFDATRQIAQNKANRLVVIEPHNFTYGYSLNKGVEVAQGHYLVIISAHTLPTTSQWLSQLIKPLDQEKVAMVYGRQKGIDLSKFSEIKDLERIFGEDHITLQSPNFFANNANSAIKKTLWSKYPFNETLPGLEDADWAKHWMQMGKTVKYQANASIYHIHDETWRQIRKRFYRESLAARAIGIKRTSHVTLEILGELRCVILDMYSALTTKRHKNFTALCLEIFLYRLNKGIGIIRGLFGNIPDYLQPNHKQLFYNASFKSVVIEKAGKASLYSSPIPDAKPGEVLIRVAYVGVCATDLEILHGTLGYYKSGLAHYPITPGHEMSGHIVQMGARVDNFNIGDAVVVECIQTTHDTSIHDKRIELGVIGQHGAYAEYLTVPSHFVHKLPYRTDLKQAVLCEPLAVVIKGLKRAHLFSAPIEVDKKNSRIAIAGAGPIGHLAAIILKYLGHNVHIFDQNASRLNALPSNIQTSTQITAINTYDVWIEATGNLDVLDLLLKEGKANTSLLLLGLPYGSREFNFESIVSEDKVIIGSVGSGKADFDDAIALLPHLDLNPFTQKILPLSEYKKAWNIAKESDSLKIILQCNSTLQDLPNQQSIVLETSVKS